MPNFVIADLHLGDMAAAARRRSLLPDCTDIDAEVIRRWNLTVSSTDTVYVLGDVGRLSRIEAVRRLHGRKHLVAGNGDDIGEMQRSGVFASITVARWLPGVLLTHIPVHPSQLRRGTINVHGHLHAQVVADPRYLCVSVEQTAFAPVPLKFPGEPARRLSTGRSGMGTP